MQRIADFWIQLLVERNNLIFCHFLILTDCSFDKKSRNMVFSPSAVSKRVEKLGVAVLITQPIHSCFLTPIDFFLDIISWNSSLALNLASLFSSGKTPLSSSLSRFWIIWSSSFLNRTLPNVVRFQIVKFLLDSRVYVVFSALHIFLWLPLPTMT